VRLIDYAPTSEIRARPSLGPLEHLAPTVEVGEERIDLWRRRCASLTSSFLLVHIRTVASVWGQPRAEST
jgi:hypothetical protein